jgi:hypothetical protein
VVVAGRFTLPEQRDCVAAQSFPYANRIGLNCMGVSDAY